MRTSGARARILLPEIAVAAVACYFLLPQGGLAQAALYDVIGGGAAAMLLLGPRGAAVRRRWHLLGIAIALFAVGDLAWDVMDFGFHNVPYPSFADGFYLAGYPFMAVGLWLWSPRGSLRARTDVIDAAIACIALGMPVWSLFIDPIEHDALRSLGGIVTLGYPVMDLLLIGVAARLWFGSPPRSAAYRLVVLGVVLMLAGDVIYAFMVQYATYESGSWVDALWLLSYVAFGAAALQPSAVQAPARTPRTATSSRQVVVLASLLFVPIGLVAASHLAGRRLDVSEILVGSSVLVALVLAQLRGVLRSLAESTSELHDAQRRAALIVENAHDAIVTVDAAGRITEFNAAAERMFGYAREELAGRAGLHALVTEGWRAAVSAHLRSLVPGGLGDSGARLEVEAVRSDGTAFPAEVTAEPLDGSVPAQSTAFFRDITQQRQLQQEQARALEAERAAVRKLQALDELKSTFLTAASHELRTPVTTILGNAKTLQRLGGGLDEVDRAALVDAIAERASGLTLLISDLLDVERLNQGAEVLRREMVDLRAVVGRATDSFDSRPDHALTVSVEPLEAHLDAVKAERIVENLVSNAVRHTPSGTPISVRAGRHDSGVLVTVEDRGPGVPEQLRSVIFEPFRQGELTNSHAPGVGIGLALVQRFAELHGGRAWVDDAPGGGAAFHVYLQCAVESTPRRRAVRTPASSA